MKKFLMLLYIARVLIPMHEVTYRNVRHYVAHDGFYTLMFEDDKEILIPTAFTIIEQQ